MLVSTSTLNTFLWAWDSSCFKLNHNVWHSTLYTTILYNTVCGIVEELTHYMTCTVVAWQTESEPDRPWYRTGAHISHAPLWPRSPSPTAMPPHPSHPRHLNLLSRQTPVCALYFLTATNSPFPSLSSQVASTQSHIKKYDKNRERGKVGKKSNSDTISGSCFCGLLVCFSLAHKGKTQHFLLWRQWLWVFIRVQIH